MAFFQKRVLISLSVLLFATSCAGGISLSKKNAQLPEEQIAKLAAQIEEAVQFSPAEPAKIDYNVDEKTGDVLGDFQPLDIIIGLDTIKEKVPALTELHADSDAMLAAIRGRILRRPAVYRMQQEGCLGETREGFVGLVKGKICGENNAEKDRVAYTVLLENRDRRTIEEQLLEALDLPHSNIDRIRNIFAEQIFVKAWAGTPLETRNGSWEKR